MKFSVIKNYLAKKAIQVVAPKPWKPVEGDDGSKVRKVLKKFQEDQSQTVSNDSLRSLHNYGFVGYADINRHLRGEKLNEGETKNVERHIKNIDDAMDVSYLKTPIVVYRALQLSFMAIKKHPLLKKLVDLGVVYPHKWGGYKLSQNNLQDLKGFSFLEHSYVSTSLNQHSEPVEKGEVLLKIRVPDGVSAVYMNAIHALGGGLTINEFAGFLDENEVLLDRGLSFKVSMANMMGSSRPDANYKDRQRILLVVDVEG